MSAKASYFKIGLFVISAATIAVIAVVVLGAGILFRETLMCETYIDQSVQGLDVGSPVKFRGVKIGNVKEIRFVVPEYLSDLDPLSEDVAKYGRLVLVRMALDPRALRYSYEEAHGLLEAETSRGLRVRMASQGLTGTAYLEVDYVDPERNPPMEIGWEPHYPHIASARSTITLLTESVDRILARMEGVDLQGIAEGIKESLAVVTKMLEGADVGEIGEGAEQLLAEVRQTNRHIDQLIEKGEIKSILNDASAAMAALRRTVEGSEKPINEVFADLPEISVSMKSFAKSLDSSSEALPETLARLRRIVQQLDELVSSQRPNVQRTLENMRAISQNVRDLSETAKRDPSSIFFGGPPPKSKRSEQ